VLLSGDLKVGKTRCSNGDIIMGSIVRYFPRFIQEAIVHSEKGMG
jgi:hypothetical protein